MEFIVAPDSFKGTMTARRITERLTQVLQIHFPEAKLHAIPVADGGDGTVDVLLTAVV